MSNRMFHVSRKRGGVGGGGFGSESGNRVVSGAAHSVTF